VRLVRGHAGRTVTRVVTVVRPTRGMVSARRRDCSRAENSLLLLEFPLGERWPPPRRHAPQRHPLQVPPTRPGLIRIATLAISSRACAGIERLCWPSRAARLRAAAICVSQRVPDSQFGVPHSTRRHTSPRKCREPFHASSRFDLRSPQALLSRQLAPQVGFEPRISRLLQTTRTDSILT
jgi:hypothetical protein